MARTTASSYAAFPLLCVTRTLCTSPVGSNLTAQRTSGLPFRLSGSRVLPRTLALIWSRCCPTTCATSVCRLLAAARAAACFIASASLAASSSAIRRIKSSSSI